MHRIISPRAMAARLRTWATAGLLALLGAVAPQAGYASTGCRLIDGKSGQLGPGQTVTLNPSQGINFNAGDLVALTSSSPNARGDLIRLDVAVISVTNFLDTMQTTQSVAMPRSVLGGPATLFVTTTQATPGLVANYAISCRSVGPTVTQIAPSSGRPGATISVVGTGFLGTSAVTFGGQPAAFTVAGDTLINATIPAGTGTVGVTVTTDAGSATGGPFTYVSAPDAPVIGAVSPGNGQATVAFSPPVNTGGLPVTNYVVTSHPGNATASGAASPLTVSGLTNGTSYTFSVTATNAAGTSVSSAASSAVVPMALPTALDRNLSTDYGKAISVDLGVATNGAGITDVTIDTPPAHGKTTVSGTVVTYTPADGFQGDTDSFTYITTNAVGRSSPGRVSVAVGRVPVRVPDAPFIGAVSAGSGQATVSFSAPADDGGSPVTNYVVISQPGGVTAAGSGSPLTVTGLANGTSYTFTVTATNAAGTSVSSAASRPVVPMALPTALDQTLATDYGKAISVDLGTATNGTGIAQVSIDMPPAHGTATVSGTVVTYVPAEGFQGATDSFTYITSNAMGHSSPGRVSITVNALAVPTPQPLAVVTTVGVPVTILPAPGTPGPQAWDRLDIGNSPAHGHVVASGRTLVYTPANGFIGTDTFAYRSGTAFAMSAPATVTVTVTREGSTGVLSRTVTALPGATVTVDLSSIQPGIASASLSGLSPGQAAEVSLSPQGVLSFTSQPSFHGLAQVSATLTTNGGAILPVSVLVLVSSQPDPSKNADALGIVAAQVEQARRFAQGQLDNIQGRLESLHDRLHDAPAVSNRLTLNVNGRAVPMSARPGIGAAGTETDTAQASPVVAADHGIRTWLGGQASFGSFDARRGGSGFDSDTVSISTGADVRVGEHGLLGMAFGYSHDNSDIGREGAHSTAQGYSAAIYGSVQPGEGMYIDLVIGGGGLRFDSRRMDADSGRQLAGRRTGQQWFGSVTTGLAYRTGAWSWSPYARASWSLSSLNGFAENGPVTSALSYGRQLVRSSIGAVGLRVSGESEQAWGTLAPRARIEIGHDFQGESRMLLAYAQIPSAGEWSVMSSPYSANGTRVQVGLGLDLRFSGGWSLGSEYSYLVQPHMRDQSIRLTVNKSL